MGEEGPCADGKDEVEISNGARVVSWVVCNGGEMVRTGPSSVVISGVVTGDWPYTLARISRRPRTVPALREVGGGACILSVLAILVRAASPPSSAIGALRISSLN
jgi:hypothetical protein